MMKPTPSPPGNQGICHLCGEKIPGPEIVQHLSACIQNRPWQAKEQPGLLFSLTAKGSPQYWLIVMAGPYAYVSDLDELIKKVWMDGNRHLSSLSVGYATFSDTGGFAGTNVYLTDLFVPGDTGTYTYDFGYSSIVRIHAISFISSYPDDDSLVILAQNYKPKRRCGICGKDALFLIDHSPRYVCSDCIRTLSIDYRQTKPLGNTPRPGSTRTNGAPAAAIPWLPDQEKQPDTKQRPVFRVDHDEIHRHPHLSKSFAGPFGTHPRPQGIRRPAIPADIPPDLQKRYQVMSRSCTQFCRNHPDSFDEEAISGFLSLIFRIPTTRHELKNGDTLPWAAGVIYAFGQMNGLFTRGRQAGWKARDIGSAFGVSDSATRNRAYRINVALRRFRVVWHYTEDESLFTGQVPDIWRDRIDTWVGDEYQGLPFALWYERWIQRGEDPEHLLT
jgi:ribosomal protein S27AE